jgi:SAM-dependent methyltransferase
MAPAPASGSMPSPHQIFDTLNSYQRTEALKAAIELDIFTAIGEGARTPEALAGRRSVSPRGVRILCDFLVTIGLLEKSAGGYSLPPDSAAFLDRRSPAYMGGAVRFVNSPMVTDPFKSLAEAVRTGGTAAGEGTVAPEHPVWVDFARAMAPLVVLPAQLMVEKAASGLPQNARVLDIAAGHGLYGLAFARRFPGAAITAVDWPSVLEVARENAGAAGVSDRYRTIAGSAFEVDLGTGYDLVLITNFLHHFGPAQNEKFLRKVHAALAPAGRALTLEFVPDPDRVTPPPAARFSLTMLAGTPEGDAYTFAELEGMFRRAGFSATTLHELPPTFFRLLESRR